ncbi:MAG: pyruvate kinase alpha/beta domain-containing protein [Pseudomonadota bacterium]
MTVYFEKSGPENTEQVLKSACERAKELGINEVVVASTKGVTAYKALDIFNGFNIIVVTYHCGFKEPFKSVMPENVKTDLKKKGATVVSATHALSGVERSLAKRFSGIYPVLIIADTLRLFGQGTKVAIEVSIMASDSGALSGSDIISIGGTGRGADTALVLKPANQSDLFDMRIREIICKPRNF